MLHLNLQPMDRSGFFTAGFSKFSNRGQYIADPNNAILKGKSLKDHQFALFHVPNMGGI